MKSDPDPNLNAIKLNWSGYGSRPICSIDGSICTHMGAHGLGWTGYMQKPNSAHLIPFKWFLTQFKFSLNLIGLGRLNFRFGSVKIKYLIMSASSDYVGLYLHNFFGTSWAHNRACLPIAELSIFIIDNWAKTENWFTHLLKILIDVWYDTSLDRMTTKIVLLKANKICGSMEWTVYTQNPNPIHLSQF